MGTDLEPVAYLCKRQFWRNLMNCNNYSNYGLLVINLKTAKALGVGQEILLLNVSHESEFDAAFATLIQSGAGALLVDGDILFSDQRDRLVKLAAHHHVPASYQVRESAVAGGLMSYGPSLSDGHRQAGLYVGRILKGERPGDLPVLRPTKFELVINLKAAKALGLGVPATVVVSENSIHVTRSQRRIRT